MNEERSASGWRLARAPTAPERSKSWSFRLHHFPIAPTALSFRLVRLLGLSAQAVVFLRRRPLGLGGAFAQNSATGQVGRGQIYRSRGVDSASRRFNKGRIFTLYIVDPQTHDVAEKPDDHCAAEECPQWRCVPRNLLSSFSEKPRKGLLKKLKAIGRTEATAIASQRGLINVG